MCYSVGNKIRQGEILEINQEFCRTLTGIYPIDKIRPIPLSHQSAIDLGFTFQVEKYRLDDCYKYHIYIRGKKYSLLHKLNFEENIDEWLFNEIEVYSVSHLQNLTKCFQYFVEFC